MQHKRARPRVASDLETGDEPRRRSSQDDDKESRLNNVHMACCLHGGVLGVAIYDVAAREISLHQSHEETQGLLAYQMLHSIKLQCQPDIIYVSNKADGQLIQTCKAQNGGSGFGNEPELQVSLERSTIFTLEQAKQQLSTLHVKGMPVCRSRKQHMEVLSTYMHLNCEQQVCALGALLAVMTKGCIGMDTSDNQTAEAGLPSTIKVDQLSELNLDGCLLVDPVSLSALQVFQEERHPSLMGIGGVKEGFSAFGMMQRCVTQMGQRLLRLWFMRPVVNLEVITDRHDTMDLLIGQPDVASAILDALKKVKDVPKLLVRLQQLQHRSRPLAFRQLLESCAAMLTLRDIFTHLAPGIADDQAQQSELGDWASAAGSDVSMSELDHLISGASTPGRQAGPRVSGRPSVPPGPRDTGWSGRMISRKILASISEDLYQCHSMVSEVLDLDASDESMAVRSGVCRQLDTMKDTYDGLPDFLTQVVESELRRIPACLARQHSTQLWSIMYLPQVGYVVQVTGEQLGADLLDALPDYHLAFTSTDSDGFAAFYTSQCTQQLNERLGDLLYKIQDMEASICAELMGRLCTFGPQLVRASAAVAELDCLLALASCAREFRLTRPVLTTDNVLHIKKGRHLLTELVVDSFIPNDTAMGEHEGRVQVVTGPNASGKSCYAKQVALLVHLAHVGCYVPAESATVGLTDRILTRLVSSESSTQGRSTFCIDLAQVAVMARQATHRSLLIIDEFGKGTLASDGVGLLCALLRHFAELPCPPKVISTTHFSEIFQERYLPRNPQLRFLTMEVLSNGRDDGAAGSESKVFLYRLEPGCAGPSFGVYCARMAGVPSAVVSRAKHVISMLESGRQLERMPNAAAVLQEQRSRTLTARLAGIDLGQATEVLALLRELHAPAGQLAQ